MKILFRNARILKMDGTPIFQSNLIVEDNKIAYIGNDIQDQGAYECVVECNGNLIMPGFKNAHTLGAMVFLRSRADNMNLQKWLFDYVLPREECLRPDDVYHLTKLAILEYLSGGITTAFEHYYNVPEIIKAGEDLGYRLAVMAAFSENNTVDKLLEKYYEYNKEKKDSLINYRLGMHAEYTSTKETVDGILEPIQMLQAPFNTHCAETEQEVKECIEKRGVTPVKFFEDNKLIDYGGMFFHCVYLSDNDIEIMKNHNVSVVTCPGSNCKLASGIAPVKKYLDRGLNVCLGTDGPASNNCLDMFKEMQLVSSLQKVINKSPEVLEPIDILKMATVNGARALGMDNCDTLEVGKNADIIEINLNRPNLQPMTNILNNLVYSGSRDDVMLTMVNGKILYRDGEFFLGEKVEDIYAKAQEVTDRLEKDYLARKKVD